MMILIEAFFSGIFLFNGLPHLVQGICGNRHMTPFNKKSRSVTNVIWAWVNLLIGGLLANNIGLQFWQGSILVVFCVGGFLTSIILSIFWSNPDAKLPWHRE